MIKKRHLYIKLKTFHFNITLNLILCHNQKYKYVFYQIALSNKKITIKTVKKKIVD